MKGNKYEYMIKMNKSSFSTNNEENEDNFPLIVKNMFKFKN